VGRRDQKILGVLGSQRGAQNDYRAEAQPTIGNHRKDKREVARQTRDPNSLRRHLFGELELTLTVGVHRRVSRRQVELAGIDLSDVGEKVGGGVAILGNQIVERAQQGVVAQVRQ